MNTDLHAADIIDQRRCEVGVLPPDRCRVLCVVRRDQLEHRGAVRHVLCQRSDLVMLGSFVLSSGYYDAYYLKALKVKAMIKKAFDDAFAKYDLILGPVAPTTAPYCFAIVPSP